MQLEGYTLGVCGGWIGQAKGGGGSKEGKKKGRS